MTLRPTGAAARSPRLISGPRKRSTTRGQALHAKSPSRMTRDGDPGVVSGPGLDVRPPPPKVMLRAATGP